MSNTTSNTKGIQAASLKGLSEAEVVERMKPLFAADMKKSGIPASLTGAQFILESGYGQTELAQNANNVFGMKRSLSGNTWSGSTWDGTSIYTKKTQEDDGKGNLYTITADFRKYPCVEDSIADHSAYLLGAMDGNDLRYKGVKGCTSYKRAAQIIKDGGYATDTHYVEKICSIIERWGLASLDWGSDGADTEKSYTIVRSPAYNKGVPSWGNKKKYIVLHYLGVDGQNNALWNNGYGAHYVIFWDGTIYKVCDHDAITWQVGTANGSYVQKHPEARNNNCIGIEMCCHNTDGYCPEDEAGMRHWYFTEATQRAAVWLVRHLMDELGLDISHVLRHHDVVNKVCPAPYVYNNHYKSSWTWSEFLDAVKGKAAQNAAEGAGSSKEETAPVYYYRVRKSWSDKASQIGAYTILQNAENAVDANPGYAAFDEEGKKVYPVEEKEVMRPYLVRVSIPDLNIRKGPGTDHEKWGRYTKEGIFTIVKEAEGPGSKTGWGLLKAYSKNEDGWISLDYVESI